MNCSTQQNASSERDEIIELQWNFLSLSMFLSLFLFLCIMWCDAVLQAPKAYANKNGNAAIKWIDLAGNENRRNENIEHTQTTIE